jgi:hypothetical protein
MLLLVNVSEHNKNLIERHYNGEGFETIPESVVDDIMFAINNATVLPTGCGKLVEADEVVKLVDKHTFDTTEGVTLDDDITCILEEAKTYKLGENNET